MSDNHQRIRRARRHVRIRRLARRYKPLFPLFSFGAGIASYFLIERQPWLATWIAIGILVSWLVVLAEGFFGEMIEKLSRGRLPAISLRYVMQAGHQESLFFVLPFFLAATTANSAHVLFTGLLILLTSISVIDPLYFRLVGNRWSFLAMHGFAIFIVLLVALPIVIHLTTTQSLQIAAVAMGIVALPSLAAVLENKVQRLWHWLPLMVASAALGYGAWLAAPAIPPAALRLTEMQITHELDIKARDPGAPLTVVPASQLDRGLHAYAAIRAPRGLREPIWHVWYQNDILRDRIELMVSGGREAGYRLWSRKRNFPPNPEGNWRVEIRTRSGQLVGEQAFTVR